MPAVLVMRLVLVVVGVLGVTFRGFNVGFEHATNAYTRAVGGMLRVSLLVLDPKNMFRWAQIQGRLASHTLEGGDDHIEHLARRYTGGAYRGPKIERMIIRIDPERVTGGENMQPWDVTG